MPHLAWNKAPTDTKRRYFKLICQGASGAAASQRVGVSLSCGSLWFIDGGRRGFRSATPRVGLICLSRCVAALSALGSSCEFGFYACFFEV
jgi:hypothetical protein